MQLRSQWQWRKTNKQVYLRFWGSIIKSPWVVDIKTNPGTINRMCERYISLGFEHSCFFVLSQYNKKKLLKLGLYSHLQWLLKFNARDELPYAKFSFKHWSSSTCLKAFWKLIKHLLNPLGLDLGCFLSLIAGLIQIPDSSLKTLESKSRRTLKLIDVAWNRFGCKNSWLTAFYSIKEQSKRAFAVSISGELLVWWGRTDRSGLHLVWWFFFILCYGFSAISLIRALGFVRV